MKFIYAIAKLKDTEENTRRRFMCMKWQEENGGLDLDQYEMVIRGTIDAEDEKEACERLYEETNTLGEGHRSMSVGDLVLLATGARPNDEPRAFFCDSIGFVEIDEDGKRI